MEIIINGNPRTLEPGLNVKELLGQLQVNERQVVIELNRLIVPHQKLASTVLQEGDSLELIHFVGGGKTGKNNDDVLKS